MIKSRYSKETSFYGSILECLQVELISNLSDIVPNVVVISGIGTLGKSLSNTVKLNKAISDKMKTQLLEYASGLADIHTDLFLVIADGSDHVLILIEVKDRETVGLKEWSQLIGYSIVSNAPLGLLININGSTSDQLNRILIQHPHIASITRMVGDIAFELNLGYMSWQSDTKQFLYSSCSTIKSMDDLSRRVAVILGYTI